MKTLLIGLCLSVQAHSICYTNNGEEVYAMCDITENFINKIESFNVTDQRPKYSKILKRGNNLSFRVKAAFHSSRKYVSLSNYLLDRNTGLTDGLTARLTSKRARKKIDTTGYADEGNRVSLSVKCQYTCID